MRLAAVVTALLLALLPVACGGDDDDSSGQSAADTTETTSTTSSETPSPAQEREALKNTDERPHIPKPTGSPPRRLVKEDIVKGKGAPAKPGDVLTVQYVGVTFSTGEEFDASWDRGEPFTTQIPGQVIEGWNRGLLGMRKGGRRMLTIPPELGYGRDGSPPAIGPNETLVFVIDLIAIQRS
jgi:peptidylprolyl isomerase